MSDSSDPSQQTNKEVVVNEIKPGVLRTPDHCFDNLPDYPFEANYVEVNGLRIHYLDEGPKDADPITKGGEQYIQKMMPGANGQPHEIIRNGGHFVQEDQGEVLAEKIAAWLSN